MKATAVTKPVKNRRRRVKTRRRRAKTRRRRPVTCTPAQVAGQEFYAWDPRGPYCYHVITGGALEQDHSSRKASKCNKAGFRKDVVIGRGKGISAQYSNGDRENCPGKKARSATLKVIRDPKAKGHNARVTEPSVCNYHIKVTSPHCKITPSPVKTRRRRVPSLTKPTSPCKVWKSEERANKKIRRVLQASVRFKKMKSTLKQEGKDVLRKVASVLKKYPWMSVTVEGSSSARKGSTCTRLVNGRAASALKFMKLVGAKNKMHTIGGKCGSTKAVHIRTPNGDKPAPAGCAAEV